MQRVRLEGFIVLDHFGRAGEIVPQLAGWMAEGKIKAQETVVEGFEQLPVAINMLFDGGNVGKLVVKV
jgi:NADPH-dependent curcumin reductase CurA